MDKRSPVVSHAETITDVERLLYQGLLTLDEIAELISWSGDGDHDERLGIEASREIVRACWLRLAPSLVRPCRSLWARVTSRRSQGPTTFERLQAAFEAMAGEGILARLFPTTDWQSALTNIHDELAIALSRGRDYEGYCVCNERSFFGQELPRIPSEQTLFFYGPRADPLTFFDGMTGARRIADKIGASLQKAGFNVAWDESPGTAIAIVDVEWKGWRDEAGAPLVRTDHLLPDEPPVERTPSAPVLSVNTRVFFSAGLGRPDAHELLSSIARHASVAMYGSLERFDSTPAAVAIRVDEKRVLDLVGGPAPNHPGLSVLQRKSNVARCRWLVATDTAYPWDEFAPARRIFVATDGVSPAPAPDAWRTVSVNLRTGAGVDQLLRVLAEAAESDAV